MRYSADPVRNPARPAAGVVLCDAAEIAPGGVKRFAFHNGADSFRGFVVRTGGGLHAYVDWCAHQGIPLQDDRDAIIRQDGLLVCQWHWARYDPETGAAVDGPCVGSLARWAISVGADGLVRTA